MKKTLIRTNIESLLDESAPVTLFIKSALERAVDLNSFSAEMTKHAASEGLGHWRCTSANSNRLWQRQDGESYEAFTGMHPDAVSYMDELRKFDKDHPMVTKPRKPR